VAGTSASTPRRKEEALASHKPSNASAFGRTSERSPEPLLSSRARQWHGILVELYHVHDVDFVKTVPEHTVTVFLRGPVDLLQQRYGRVVRRTMRAGDVLVSPAGEPKALRHKEEAELVKLQLAPSHFAGIVDELDANGSGPVELLDNFGTRDAYIEDVARRLLAELETDNLAGRLYADSLATALSVHLLRNYSTAGRIGTASSPKLPRFKVQRVTDYIDDHLHDELTLQRLSATLSMSPFHFAHAFRKTTGLAPHRFLIQRRVDRAKILLCETDLSIAEIAHQVGYAHQSNFSVVFHRVTGRTPRSYRSEA
jgi:AraC family transcriptional regulator